MMTTIVLFRQDLRLADNPALWEAVSAGDPIIPVYIWNPELEHPWAPGAAMRWWLHQGLSSLEQQLHKMDSRLHYLTGSPLEVLPPFINEVGARRVYWNRRYEPAAIQADTQLKSRLRDLGLEVQSFNASLLFEPWEVKTRQGDFYKVFTPFWKACRSLQEPPEPLPVPKSIPYPRSGNLSNIRLEELNLLPRINWTDFMAKTWEPGETGALKQLSWFLETALVHYEDDRNRPDRMGSSRLSPYLHTGQISPRQIWHAVLEHRDGRNRNGLTPAGECYLRELVWREFAYHLLYHLPHTTNEPLHPEFNAFPWDDNPKLLKAWQQGRTGYPIVDAGMRELWRTGWMHNRVRMIVASFLVKDLMIPWQRGAEWFWDTLIDADLANNTLGWQWTAGCGADAAPYFRIFNPVGQGKKFDPDGKYVRKFVPELSNLPEQWIHTPWEAPAQVLDQAGIRLGETYPLPLVDHGVARDRALEAYNRIKKK